MDDPKTEILKSSPDYSRGFLDGRKYVLKLILRAIESQSATKRDIKETIENLLKD